MSEEFLNIKCPRCESPASRQIGIDRSGFWPFYHFCCTECGLVWDQVDNEALYGVVGKIPLEEERKT